MDALTVEYSGYQIVVTPVLDHEDLWDFSYSITKDGDELPGQAGHSSHRKGSLGRYTDAKTACDAGAQTARVEVDNYLAMHQ